MKSIASAPGKIILLGEHFVVYGSKAILAAIDKRVTVTSSLTEDKTIKIKSRLGTLEVPIYVSHQEVKSEFRPFVYLAKKMLISAKADTERWKNMRPAEGLEIAINSDIPVGVGLGSSSACCVAATASIYGLMPRGAIDQLSLEEIVEMSIEAEKTIFPDTSGADCNVCTYGGMIVYDKINGIEKIDIARCYELGIGWEDYEDDPAQQKTVFNFIIANSMIPHSTKRSVEKVKKFKEKNEEEFSTTCRYITNVINELLYKMNMDMDDPDRLPFGDELHDAMSSNRMFLGQLPISNNTINRMLSSLVSPEGYGAGLGSAKITGAGDGGCIIALAHNIERDLTMARGVLGKDKECFSAKIDTKGVVRRWLTEESDDLGDDLDI